MARPSVRCGLEDGGFRGLPGGWRRDASAAAHPPLGEVATRAQSCGERGFGTRTGSGLLVPVENGEVAGSGPWEGHGRGREWESRGRGSHTAGLQAEERPPILVLSPGRPFPTAGPAEVV